MVYVVSKLSANMQRRPPAAARALFWLNLIPAKMVRSWRERRELARQRHYAAQFTDRDLWDVGLTRGDVHREFSRRP